MSKKYVWLFPFSDTGVFFTNQICFALRGSHTGTVRISGTKLNSVTFEREQFYANAESAVPIYPDR